MEVEEMAPDRVEPYSDRQRLVETLIGALLVVLGVTVWMIEPSSDHSHRMHEGLVIALTLFGALLVNKKLVLEGLAEVAEFVPFLRRRKENASE